MRSYVAAPLPHIKQKVIKLSNTIDGKALAAQIRSELRSRAAAYHDRTGRMPGLGVILVGDDPASQVYVRNKERACEEVGILSEVVHLPASASEEEVLDVVERMNNDEKLDGVIVQLPLPDGLDPQKISHSVVPEKDVDGLHPVNAGRLMANASCLASCTPRAVLRLIKSTGIDIDGKHAVIVGRSSLVGKPLAMLLLAENATVTVCHSRTPDLAEKCSDADILISAAGQPGLITDAHVRPGAIVIDVGTTRIDGRVRGDVDFDAATGNASWITPVPGGVGPMTVTMLLENTLDACGA